jgi:GTPase
LTAEIKKDLPDVPSIFISSVAEKGIVELKDMIWQALQD